MCRAVLGFPAVPLHRRCSGNSYFFQPPPTPPSSPISIALPADRNTTLPSTRGTAFGVFNLFDDLGKGLGPALVSLIVVRRGRENAFTLAFLAWFVCGTILLAMTCWVARDESKVSGGSNITEFFPVTILAFLSNAEF